MFTRFGALPTLPMTTEFASTRTSAEVVGPAWALCLTATMVAFTGVFLLVDQSYLRFIDARFPTVGASVWLATLWGVVSRLHWLILTIPLIVWRPRFFGLRFGSTSSHLRTLTTMLLANCGLVAGYLWLSGSTTALQREPVAFHRSRHCTAR